MAAQPPAYVASGLVLPGAAPQIATTIRGGGGVQLWIALDGQPCGRNTCGLLERRHVQIGRKILIRKESNRRWEHGNDLSMLSGHELDQPDSTATEYVRLEDSRKHKTHAVASMPLREWLKRVPLDLVSYHANIDRHTLRSVRDAKPARREILFTLAELKKLWLNAEKCGALKIAKEAVRKSRRDYTNCGELRELMFREKKAKGFSQ
jgi:hypothetical protein